MSTRLLVIIALVTLVCFGVTAQPKQQAEITMAQTIEYLNKKLGNDFKVELAENDREIIISFYKNATVYKIDKVYLETLDSAKVSFSQDEKALVIRCKDAKELTGKLKKFKSGCVEREIIDKNTRNFYGRINIEAGMDKKKIASLTKAFVHLIKLAQDENYKSNVPFE